VAEAARRWGGLGRRGAGLAPLGWVLAVSCLYEIFEWLLTVVAAGETADRYNGQQGDDWDAQKDMALAALGAILVVAVRAASRDRRRECATSSLSR
jgi:putative membrane protein